VINNKYARFYILLSLNYSMYSISEYYKFSKEIYNQKGLTGVYNDGKNYMYESSLRFVEPILSQESEYVLNKEWDVLIILDGCRVDLLEEVAEEYDFIEKPPHNTIWSADSYSEGWLINNFKKLSREQKNKRNSLTHVTGNPFTETVFKGDEFNILDEVWKYGWDNKEGYLPPNIVTDRAITNYRKNNSQKMIVHYMQPHAPFIGENNMGYHIDTTNFNNVENSISKDTPWELFRDNKISRDELWDAYKNTLHIVLKSVEKLLRNIDAEKVVISSDHGNAMGEWGIYGHPRHLPVPSLRKVPWIKTTARNTENYQPKKYNINNKDLNRNEQLEALGYK